MIGSSREGGLGWVGKKSPPTFWLRTYYRIGGRSDIFKDCVLRALSPLAVAVCPYKPLRYIWLTIRPANRGIYGGGLWKVYIGLGYVYMLKTRLALLISSLIFSAFVVLYYSVGYMYRITGENIVCCIWVLMARRLVTSSMTSRDSMTSYS